MENQFLVVPKYFIVLQDIRFSNRVPLQFEITNSFRLLIYSNIVNLVIRSAKDR